MSTYDAYNLSLRDSTEFTVPTGGSGNNSNGRFSIFNVRIKGVPYQNVSDSYVIGTYDMQILQTEQYIPSFDADLAVLAGSDIPADNEYHDYSFVAVDGAAYFFPIPKTAIVNLIGSAELIVEEDDFENRFYVKITGNCQFDYIDNEDPNNR